MLFILLLWIAGIFFSRFLQSLATALLCTIFLFQKDNKRVPEALKTWLGLSLIPVFILFLLSCLNSENQHVFWNLFKNKIPFLFIPISIYALKNTESDRFHLLLYVFIACTVISSGWSFTRYWGQESYYRQLYTQGGVMPTLVHHVSFSVLCVFAVLFILYRLSNNPKRTEVILLVLCLGWIVYFIHLLAVRTGIILLYLSVLFYGLGLMIGKRQYTFAGLLFVLLFVSAYISYRNIPNIKSKIAYTFYSFGELRKGSDSSNVFSDSRRILSDKIGMEIVKKNRISGVGLGDLQDEMDAVYQHRYPSFSTAVYAHIHNEYLYVLAALGCISGTLVCMCFLIPLLYFIRSGDLLFSVVYLCLLLVFTWEPFIENQLGNSVFLWICCMGYVRPKS